MSRGLCAQVDPELFFPEIGFHTQSRVAKSVCRQCDVRVECLDYSLDRDVLGIWGGTDRAERKRMRRSA